MDFCDEAQLADHHADLVVKSGVTEQQPVMVLGDADLGTGNNLVAVKHDDALVPVHLWNDRLSSLYSAAIERSGMGMQRFGELLEVI